MSGKSSFSKKIQEHKKFKNNSRNSSIAGYPAFGKGHGRERARVEGWKNYFIGRNFCYFDSHSLKSPK